MKKAPFGSFFVYRHLGLAGCNIVLMKCFLPQLLIIGLAPHPKFSNQLNSGKKNKVSDI